MQEMREMQLASLGREDPLEEETATHSSILAWKIPWTEEPGGLQSMGWQRVRHDWVNEHTQQTLSSLVAVNNPHSTHLSPSSLELISFPSFYAIYSSWNTPKTTGLFLKYAEITSWGEHWVSRLAVSYTQFFWAAFCQMELFCFREYILPSGVSESPAHLWSHSFSV